MDLLPQSKLEMIPDLLEREDCDVWIILSREHNYDLLGADFGLHPIGDYAVAFDRDGRRLALTDNYFAPSLRAAGIFEVAQFVESDYLVEMEKFVKRYDGKKVAVDISYEYSVAGGLSSSLFNELRRILPEAIFVSSENIVMALRAVLNQEEQAKVRKAIRLTEEILHEVEVNLLHVGMSESQLFLETQKLVRQRTDGFAWHEIVNPLLIIGDSDIFESSSIESKKKIEAGDSDQYRSRRSLQRICFGHHLHLLGQRRQERCTGKGQTLRNRPGCEGCGERGAQGGSHRREHRCDRPELHYQSQASTI